MSKKDLIDSQIVAIIRKESVQEQSELQKILKACGYDIPQATLSRRLKKLNIAKVGGVYSVVDRGYSPIPPVLNMKISDFGIIVLHTHPGNANALAAHIDQQYVDFSPDDNKNSGIVGTLAGDDTVLVVVKDKESLAHVTALFHKLFLC